MVYFKFDMSLTQKRWSFTQKQACFTQNTSKIDSKRVLSCWDFNAYKCSEQQFQKKILMVQVLMVRVQTLIPTQKTNPSFW